MAETVSIEEYVKEVEKNSNIELNAVQRMRDMIVSKGMDRVTIRGQEVPHYNFFDDVQQDGSNGRNALIGLEVPLSKLVSHLNSASKGTGAEQRQILLHGPVGSAKSTLARGLKRGLEAFSHESPLYTFEWVDLGTSRNPTEVNGVELFNYRSPANQSPLYLLPLDMRADVLGRVNDMDRREKIGDTNTAKIFANGRLDPLSELIYSTLVNSGEGFSEERWLDVMNKHVKITRLYLNEATKTGISSIEPTDEKNQDITELVGGPDFSRIGRFGDLGDPRTYNFNGALITCNRGMFEGIEELKLQQEFLYSLLSATSEQEVKPRGYSHIPIDTVIIGHTNEAEYRKLQANEFMEALRDRTVTIHIPYTTVLSHEVKIHESRVNTDMLGKHVAPHSIEAAAVYGVLSRLEMPPGETEETLVTKMRIYDDQRVEGVNHAKTLKEYISHITNEGFNGLGPRWVNNILSEAGSDPLHDNCVDAILVLEKIEGAAKDALSIPDKKERDSRRSLFEGAAEYIASQILDDVMAATSDEESIREVTLGYVKNATAYSNKTEVDDPMYSSKKAKPNEKMMRGIEERLGVTEDNKDEFRKTFVSDLGTSYLDNTERSKSAMSRDEFVDRYCRKQPKFRRAVVKYVYDQTKHTIDFVGMVEGSKQGDPVQLGKMAEVRDNLIEKVGYCNDCAGRAIQMTARKIASEK